MISYFRITADRYEEGKNLMLKNSERTRNTNILPAGFSLARRNRVTLLNRLRTVVGMCVQLTRRWRPKCNPITMKCSKRSDNIIMSENTEILRGFERIYRTDTDRVTDLDIDL